MDPPADMERLGRRVRQRRLALNLSQRDAASRARISDQTWLNVENGRGASDRKLAQIERALDWPPGTIDAILTSGEQPVIEVPPTRDQLLAILAAEDLSDDEIEQVLTFIRNLHRRIG